MIPMADEAVNMLNAPEKHLANESNKNADIIANLESEAEGELPQKRGEQDLKIDLKSIFLPPV